MDCLFSHHIFPAFPVILNILGSIYDYIPDNYSPPGYHGRNDEDYYDDDRYESKYNSDYRRRRGPSKVNLTKTG